MVLYRRQRQGVRQDVKTTTMLLTALVAIAAATAWSMDLTTAKQYGLVGEKENGYLGTVKPDASEEAKALVEDVNDKRRARYLTIASENGIPLKVVEERAGKTSIERTRIGHYYKEDNRWRKKGEN